MTEKDFKRPESVLVVVYTRQGDVLMLERLQPGGFWQSVTGSLEWGETPRQAAIRELREETGLTEKVLDCHRSNRFRIHPDWRAKYKPDVHENIEHVFRVELGQIVDVRLDPSEHCRFEWMDRVSAAEHASAEFNRAEILALPVLS